MGVGAISRNRSGRDHVPGWGLDLLVIPVVHPGSARVTEVGSRAVGVVPVAGVGVVGWRGLLGEGDLRGGDRITAVRTAHIIPPATLLLDHKGVRLQWRTTCLKLIRTYTYVQCLW